MVNWDKPKIQSDVVNSIRFYIMLSMIMVKNGEEEIIASKSLNSYFKEGFIWHNNDQKIIWAHVQSAYDSLPSSFLKYFDLVIPGQRDGLKYLEKSIWKR